MQMHADTHMQHRAEYPQAALAPGVRATAGAGSRSLICRPVLLLGLSVSGPQMPN